VNLVHIGDNERGIAMVKKAIALNPSHPTWYHFGFFHYQYRQGDFEAALAATLQTGWVGNFWYHAQAAASYGQLGRLEEAQEQVGKVLELYPDFPANWWDEIAKWSFTDAGAELFADGLRKAGLDIADKPALTQ
ncbi:MAG: tetratricopeptide repeat protein, partial [Alphaproteobacteria bacterium]|nr:tetratricopeptide repeat protein [Alphaproteobacteria bacterium]